jgi:hypothetical protein
LEGLIMTARWKVALLLLLAATAVARADSATKPPMPDPCIKAPNLPYCG